MDRPYRGSDRGVTPRLMDAVGVGSLASHSAFVAAGGRRRTDWCGYAGDDWRRIVCAGTHEADSGGPRRIVVLLRRVKKL